MLVIVRMCQDVVVTTKHLIGQDRVVSVNVQGIKYFLGINVFAPATVLKKEALLTYAWNVMKLTNAHEDDLRILVGKGYITILDNEDLVAYLNDWETNNVIRSDRYHKGVYKDLKIRILDAQPVLTTDNDNQMTTIRQPTGNHSTTK